MENDITIVRAVAPEDIAVGTYVVELRRVHEFINRCSLFGTMPEDGPMIRTVVTMPPRGPVILRVEAVAVPLVFVTRTNGKCAVIDIRRSRLGVVPANFGKAVFEGLAKNAGEDVDTIEDTSTLPASAD